MKIRILSVLLLLSITLTGCGNGKNNNSSSVTENSINTENSTGDEKGSQKLTISSMKGPTGMSLAYLKNLDKYEIKIQDSIEEQMSSIQKSDSDIFLVPSNLFAKLQNNKGDLKVISPNIGMPLTLIGSKKIDSVKDMKGSTISLTGKGAIPEAILRKILERSEMTEDDININFIQDPTQAVPQLLKDENSFALLPEPFVTAVLTKNDKLQRSLDIKKLWEEMSLPPVITSVIVVKDLTYSEKTEAIYEFLQVYNKGIDNILKDPNNFANIIEEMGIVKAPIAEKSITNIDFLKYEKDEFTDDLSQFLEVILDLNPELIGGKIPVME
ncbi:ABC transporter substrate-binding protein [Lagierella sp.]|uniref:ABC transporter substrate-binding protein n=1 Tax=Lagierella sp. TaxID=2849657 RepID=UPI00260A42A0|nr:ABC transporter substrate-binding protein [Lagierella sp.]